MGKMGDRRRRRQVMAEDRSPRRHRTCRFLRYDIAPRRAIHDEAIGSVSAALQRGPRAAAGHRVASSNGMRYDPGVIRSFRYKDAEQLFDRKPIRRFGADVQRTALRKLRQLDAAITLEDLRIPPGNRLERLRG